MKDFIPYEQALALKELGFDEPCFAYYKDKGDGQHVLLRNSIGGSQNSKHHNFDCTSPLYQQAFRWFRENYNLSHEISYAGNIEEYPAYVKDYIYGNNGISPSVFTYEEAELACLKKLIEIVKQ